MKKHTKKKIIVRYSILITTILFTTLITGIVKTSGSYEVSEILIINTPLDPSSAIEELKMCDPSNIDSANECRLNTEHINEILYSDEDKSATSAVVDLIDALPTVENLVLVDATQVEAARTAYDGLTESQKLLVLNYATLTAAEGQIEVLKEADILAQADVSAAQVVTDLITALPTLEEIIPDDVVQIEAARLAYNGLTEPQKVLVSNYATLTASEEQIQALIDAIDIVEDGTTGDDGSGADAPEPEPTPDPIIQTGEDESLTVIAI